MITERNHPAQPKKVFGRLQSRVLAIMTAVALLVSLFSPMVAGRTVAAAGLSPNAAKESASGQQWPAGLWQAYQRIHPHASGGSYTQSAEFSATDTAAFDSFGSAVSLSSDGSTALIGARGANSGKGAAYIFSNNGGSWSQIAKLTASDGAAFDYFGGSVALSSDGSTALIGADGKNSSKGEAYIFSKGSGWSNNSVNQIAELTASDGAGSDAFGYAVALSNDGSTALIGAYYKNSSKGEAYIFSKGSGWTTGTETAKLTASDGAANDSFGYAVALSNDGSTALISAENKNSSAGAAYIFTKGTGWNSGTETAKLTANDGASGGSLGRAVALSSDGSIALIGARGANSGKGAAYIFTKGTGWSNGSTNQTAELTANDGASGDAFGSAVALSSDGAIALIGAPIHNISIGAAYVFSTNSGWSSSTQTAELTPADGAPFDIRTSQGDQFGSAVSISSNGATAFVGSPNHSNTGAAYVFNAPTTAATTTTVSSAPNPSVYGQPITFTANVTPITVTGSVNFNLNNSTVVTGSLDNTGTATYVTNTLPAGVYTVTATYNGDSNDATSTSSAITQTVNKDNSSVALAASPTTSNLNDDVVYTATVTAASSTYTPTGSVVFSDTTTGTAIGSATLNNAGVAVFDTTNNGSKYLDGGSHNVVAIYTGSSNYNGNTSNSVTVNVASQSGIAVNSSLSPSTYGQSVTFTATVNINSTGDSTNSGGGVVSFAVPSPQTVAFSVDGNTVAQNVAVVGGVATYITNTLTVGQHGVVATYKGGTNEQDSTSAIFTQTVNAANTTLTITPAATNVGANQPTTITATVAPVSPGAGVPTGSVVFTDTTTGMTLGTVNLNNNGVAVLSSVSFNTLGSHNIEAVYAGDSNFNASNNSTSLNISQSTTTALASSSNPAVFGQSVTFTATVSAALNNSSTHSKVKVGIDGMVSFTVDGKDVSDVAVDSNGVATYVTSTLSVGQHPVQANYQGSTNYGASSNSLTETINQANTTTSLVAMPTALNLNGSVTLTATVTVAEPGVATPTGSVVFSDTTTGKSLGTVGLNNNQQAVLTTNSLNGGSHNIVAMYEGDTDTAASNSTPQTVDVTSPSGVVVSSSTNPSTYGQSVTFTATVNITSTAVPNVAGHGATPNTVSFAIDNNSVASNVAVVGGVATYTTSNLSVGKHSVVASYSGDTNVATATSATYTQTVTAANTTTSLSSAPNASVSGQSVTLTATVAAVAPGAGVPTGSVIFTDTTSGTSLGSGTLNANGVATVNVSTLAVGLHSLTASYAGDANFNGSSANLTQTVSMNATSLTLSSGPNPSTAGQSVTFTAMISPAAASGNISFTIDNSTVSATLNNGVATYVTSTLAVGNHTATATYAGNSTYGSSTSNTVTQVVNAANGGGGGNNNPNYNYLLPFLANNGAGANIVNMRGVSAKASSYTTFVSIENGSSSPVTFTTTYYNAQGSVIGTDNNGGNALAPNNRYLPTSPLANGQNASAVVVSSQPLNIVVSESGTVNGIATASSYTAVNVGTDAASTIYAPIAINNAYGGYTTNFILANLGNSNTTATINYYSDNGTKAGSQSVSLAAHAQTNVSQSSGANLSSGFSGWAVISSNGNQALSGQVVETNPNFGFLETVDMPGMSGKTLFVPTVFQNAFGNFNTGMQLVNPNGTAANVTVTYYRKDGTKITTTSGHGSFSIGANSDTSFYHSTSNFPELNTPNGGFVGTAIVTSDQPLIAIVNQAGSLGGVQYNGAFGTVLTGAAKVSVPVAVKNAYGYTTGLQVTNVSSVASTATLTYYDQSGNKVYATTVKSDAGSAIPAYGSANPYLGIESNLPSGFNGVAVVTADTAGAQFVVIANNASSQFFYTYANNS